MTFYKIGFYFMVPEGVMAGYASVDMAIITTENIYVEQSFDAFCDALGASPIPYVAY